MSEQTQPPDEENLLQSTAFRTAQSILQARRRAEEELVRAKEALEDRARQLARSLSILRATLESTTDAILVTGPDGAHVDHNEKFAELWGSSRELLPDTQRDALWARMAARALDPARLLARVAEIEGSRSESSDVLQLADGRVFQLFSNSQVVADSVGGRVWSFRDDTTRKAHEAALRSSHAQFSTLIDHSPVGILLVDAELRLRQVNSAAQPMLAAIGPAVGRELSDVVFRLWPDAVAVELLERFRETLETGESYSCMGFSSVRRDRGVQEHYDWELHRLTLPDGRYGVACYLIDISDHVRAQEALRDSEQRVRATFEQAAVGMGVAGIDGRFVQVNRRFTQILGYTVEELCARTFLDITHPDDVARTRACVQRLLAGEISDYSLEKRYVHKDGRAIWSLTTVALLRRSGGEPERFVGVVEDITARKLAEQREHEASHRLQLALSAGRLGDWSWDAASDEVSLSARAAECFGLPRGAEITWTAMRGYLHPDDRDRAAAAVEESLRARSDYDIEYRVNRPSGDEVWIAAKGRGVYGSDGEPTGMIGVVQDVTERKHLELGQLRLAAVVESSDDAILSRDLDGIIETWNSGAERIFGYTADEMIGQPITRLIPLELREEEQRILERQRRGERIDQYETVRETKDGRKLDVSLTISPIRDASGRIVGASKVARDITARKRAETREREALWDESRLLSLLNETGKSIAGDLDLESLVQSITDATTQLSGAEFGAFFYVSSDEAGEKLLLFTLSGADRTLFEQFGQPRATPLFGQTFRGEGPIRIDDVLTDERYGSWGPHYGTPDGHLPVRSYLAVPVFSRNSEVIGGLFFGHSTPGVFTERIERIVVGIAAHAAVAIDNARLYERVKRDAESRKELLEAERGARAEAERASFMKDEFLATLSHELRTPLNAIVGWSHVLRARGHADPELLEGLAVIDRNAKVQAQLIGDLLDMSRIISGKVRLDVQRVDIQDVIGAAIAAVRHSADSKGIRFQVVLDPQAGPVLGDPSRLQQCFWNLLSNAIKFTAKGGRVQVTLARIDSHVEFHVVDDGQGISPEFLPYIFERFRQADSSTTRHHGGLGLGLAIVKSLVELHGGSVHASSAGLGQGAAFCIELPVMIVAEGGADARREHLQTESPQGAPLEHPSLAGITVLAVDDEADARGLLKRVLEDCGARVLVADSARAALEILQSEKPHILISDIGMPQEDGYSLIRQVRKLAPQQGGGIPAAALSAFARPEDRTRALRAGYQMHLSKPVEPTELTAVVASLAMRS